MVRSVLTKLSDVYVVGGIFSVAPGRTPAPARPIESLTLFESAIRLAGLLGWYCAGFGCPDVTQGRRISRRRNADLLSHWRAAASLRRQRNRLFGFRRRSTRHHI
jgi:hypothetical protein